DPRMGARRQVGDDVSKRLPPARAAHRDRSPVRSHRERHARHARAPRARTTTARDTRDVHASSVDRVHEGVRRLRPGDERRVMTTVKFGGITPYMHYEDAAAILDWLARVFGFRETSRYVDGDGRVREAGMLVGDSQLWISGRDPGYWEGKGRGPE